MFELQKQVVVEVALERASSSSCVRNKPFQCDRCRKRFPERDWLAEHKIEVDLDRYFMWFRFVCVSVLLLLQLLCVGGRCSRTHILADHINNQPFSITIKRNRQMTTIAERNNRVSIYFFSSRILTSSVSSLLSSEFENSSRRSSSVTTFDAMLMANVSNG
jgi:hypothetical protein